MNWRNDNNFLSSSLTLFVILLSTASSRVINQESRLYGEHLPRLYPQGGREWMHYPKIAQPPYLESDFNSDDVIIDNAEESSFEEVPSTHTKAQGQSTTKNVVKPLSTNDDDKTVVVVKTRAQAVKGQAEAQPLVKDESKEAEGESTSDFTFIAIVSGCSAAAVFGVVAAGFCWYKLQKNAKAAAEADYPVYGVTGPNPQETAISPTGGVGDRKLAHHAQMYHYQHQKQQMIAMEKNTSDRHVSTSDLDSEEENEEGDYTVYECPGLAPPGEMEVKNPLFQDEPTPASPPVTSKSIEK